MTNLRHLLIFASVGKLLNLTRVSEVLRTTQPSITRSLKTLEERLKAKIYQRKGRGIELTEFGKRTLIDVNSIVGQLENLERGYSSPAVATGLQTLDVAGSHGPSATFLPSLLAVFKKKHPQVEINLRTDSKRSIEKLILKAEVEIAVVMDSPHSSEMEAEVCRQEKFVLFAPAGHPVTRRRDLTLVDLARFPLVVRESNRKTGAVRQILKRIESRGLRPNDSMRCDSFDAVKTGVRRRIGLGILYSDVVAPDIKSGEFKIINISGVRIQEPSYIIYRKERPLSKHAQNFLALLRESRGRSRA